MQRILILILALSLVIGAHSFCPKHNGQECGGEITHKIRGKDVKVVHGRCVTNGDKQECDCETGFSGADCMTHGCVKTLNDCSGTTHGTCLDVGLELQNPDVSYAAKNAMGEFPSCKCKDGFTGETCAEKACTTPCKNDGACVNGVCHCKFGWAGDDCALPACGAGTEKVTADNCANDDGEDKCNYKNIPISNENNKACNSHGKCKLPGANSPAGTNVHCKCNDGYEGVTCKDQKALTNCPSSTDGSVCSNNGNCEEDTVNPDQGRCVCNHGYKGADCSEKICPQDCHKAEKQGVCDQRLRACVCKKGFTGDACEIPDCGGTTRKRTQDNAFKIVVECNGHGTCGSDHKCQCNDLYTGDDCSKELCPENCNGDRGECKVVGNSPRSCVCKEPYEGVSCSDIKRSFCNDHGEGKDEYCFAVTGKCSTKAPHAEKQKCMCQPGFTGTRCEISACLNVEDGHPKKGLPCSGPTQGECVNNRKCKCKIGFVGPKCGRACPVGKGGKICSDNGECTYSKTDTVKGKCECGMGWTGNACETPTCETGKNALGEIEVCSGKAKGICENSKCWCRDGWMQGNCEKPVCPGDCNGHGRCNGATSRCHCEHGWTGEGCNLQACCDPNCSGNGKCTNGTCICSEGWFGMSCESRSPHNPGTHNCKKLHNCFKHGECDEAANKCICEVNAVTNQPMWKGKFCETPVCHKDCFGNGKCVYSANGLKGICKCNAGWSGQFCQKQGCPHSCSQHGYCLNGTCFCHPGFTGAGCERKACPNACSGHGICEDSGLCACVNGFSGEDCSKKPCPGHSAAGACSGHGVCDNGKCKCVGFHPIPFNDEAMWVGDDCGEQTCPSGKYDGTTLVKNACSGKGICDIKNKSISECLCEEGFGGKGCEMHTCKGWGKHYGKNKYQWKTDKCNNRGKCVDGRGKLPTCECNRGFAGDSCEQRSCDWDPIAKRDMPNCYADAKPTPHGVCTNGTCYCHTNFTGEHCQLAACKKCANKDKCENGCSDHGACVKVEVDDPLNPKRVLFKCQCNVDRHGSDCSGVGPSFKAISSLVHPVHGKPCQSSCQNQCGSAKSKTKLDTTHVRSCIWKCTNQCVSKGEHGKIKRSHEKLRSQF